MNFDITIFWLILWGVAVVFFMSGYILQGIFRDNEDYYIEQLENRNRGLEDRVEELEK